MFSNLLAIGAKIKKDIEIINMPTTIYVDM